MSLNRPQLLELQRERQETLELRDRLLTGRLNEEMYAPTVSMMKEKEKERHIGSDTVADGDSHDAFANQEAALGAALAKIAQKKVIEVREGVETLRTIRAKKKAFMLPTDSEEEEAYLNNYNAVNERIEQALQDHKEYANSSNFPLIEEMTRDPYGEEIDAKRRFAAFDVDESPYKAVQQQLARFEVPANLALARDLGVTRESAVAAGVSDKADHEYVNMLHDALEQANARIANLLQRYKQAEDKMSNMNSERQNVVSMLDGKFDEVARLKVRNQGLEEQMRKIKTSKELDGLCTNEQVQHLIALQDENTDLKAVNAMLLQENHMIKIKENRDILSSRHQSAVKEVQAATLASENTKKLVDLYETSLKEEKKTGIMQGASRPFVLPTLASLMQGYIEKRRLREYLRKVECDAMRSNDVDGGGKTERSLAQRKSVFHESDFLSRPMGSLSPKRCSSVTENEMVQQPENEPSSRPETNKSEDPSKRSSFCELTSSAKQAPVMPVISRAWRVLMEHTAAYVNKSRKELQLKMKAHIDTLRHLNLSLTQQLNVVAAERDAKCEEITNLEEEFMLNMKALAMRGPAAEGACTVKVTSVGVQTQPARKDVAVQESLLGGEGVAPWGYVARTTSHRMGAAFQHGVNSGGPQQNEIQFLRRKLDAMVARNHRLDMRIFEQRSQSSHSQSDDDKDFAPLVVTKQTIAKEGCEDDDGMYLSKKPLETFTLEEIRLQRCLYNIVFAQSRFHSSPPITRKLEALSKISTHPGVGTTALLSFQMQGLYYLEHLNWAKLAHVREEMYYTHPSVELLVKIKNCYREIKDLEGDVGHLLRLPLVLSAAHHVHEKLRRAPPPSYIPYEVKYKEPFSSVVSKFNLLSPQQAHGAFVASKGLQYGNSTAMNEKMVPLRTAEALKQAAEILQLENVPRDIVIRHKLLHCTETATSIAQFYGVAPKNVKVTHGIAEITDITLSRACDAFVEGQDTAVLLRGVPDRVLAQMEHIIISEDIHIFNEELSPNSVLYLQVARREELEQEAKRTREKQEEFTSISMYNTLAGERLEAIARSTGTTVEEILLLNEPLFQENPELLEVSEVLIPAKDTQNIDPAISRLVCVHETSASDTLLSVAGKYKVDVAELEDVNNCANSSFFGIYPETALQTCGISSLLIPIATQTTLSIAARDSGAIFQLYKMSEGETMTRVSTMHGVHPGEIGIYKAALKEATAVRVPQVKITAEAPTPMRVFIDVRLAHKEVIPLDLEQYLCDKAERPAHIIRFSAKLRKAVACVTTPDRCAAEYVFDKVRRLQGVPNIESCELTMRTVLIPGQISTHMSTEGDSLHSLSVRFAVPSLELRLHNPRLCKIADEEALPCGTPILHPLSQPPPQPLQSLTEESKPRSPRSPRFSIFAPDTTARPIEEALEDIEKGAEETTPLEEVPLPPTHEEKDQLIEPPRIPMEEDRRVSVPPELFCQYVTVEHATKATAFAKKWKTTIKKVLQLNRTIWSMVKTVRVPATREMACDLLEKKALEVETFNTPTLVTHYTVKDDETLETVAEHFGIPSAEIQETGPRQLVIPVRDQDALTKVDPSDDLFIMHPVGGTFDDVDSALASIARIYNVSEETLHIDTFIEEKSCMAIDGDRRISRTTSIVPVDDDRMISQTDVVPVDGDRKISQPSIVPIDDEKGISETSIVPVDDERMISQTDVVPVDGDRKISQPSIVPIDDEKGISETSIVPVDDERRISQTNVAARKNLRHALVQTSGQMLLQPLYSPPLSSPLMQQSTASSLSPSLNLAFFAEHKVEPEESITALAKKLLTTLEIMIDANPKVLGSVKCVTVPVDSEVARNTLTNHHPHGDDSEELISVSPAAPRVMFLHTVQPEETVLSITTMYNTNEEALLVANPHLRESQQHDAAMPLSDSIVIVVPLSDPLKVPVTAAGELFIEHSVQSGDTLQRIADLYSADKSEIVLKEKDAHVGIDVIRVPISHQQAMTLVPMNAEDAKDAPKVILKATTSTDAGLRIPDFQALHTVLTMMPKPSTSPALAKSPQKELRRPTIGAGTDDGAPEDLLKAMANAIEPKVVVAPPLPPPVRTAIAKVQTDTPPIEKSKPTRSSSVVSTLKIASLVEATVQTEPEVRGPPSTMTPGRRTPPAQGLTTYAVVEGSVIRRKSSQRDLPALSPVKPLEPPQPLPSSQVTDELKAALAEWKQMGLEAQAEADRLRERLDERQESIGVATYILSRQIRDLRGAHNTLKGLLASQLHELYKQLHDHLMATLPFFQTSSGEGVVFNAGSHDKVVMDGIRVVAVNISQNIKDRLAARRRAKSLLPLQREDEMSDIAWVRHKLRDIGKFETTLLGSTNPQKQLQHKSAKVEKKVSLKEDVPLNDGSVSDEEVAPSAGETPGLAPFELMRVMQGKEGQEELQTLYSSLQTDIVRIVKREVSMQKIELENQPAVTAVPGDVQAVLENLDTVQLNPEQLSKLEDFRRVDQELRREQVKKTFAIMESKKKVQGWREEIRDTKDNLERTHLLKITELWVRWLEKWNEQRKEILKARQRNILMLMIFMREVAAGTTVVAASVVSHPFIPTKPKGHPGKIVKGQAELRGLELPTKPHS